MRHASNRNPYPLPLQLTPPGTLAAHGNFCLVLLCSQPDTVHRHPLRKTQTSSPLVKGSNMSQKPSAYHHPCYSGFQVQGAAAPPAARWLQYNHFPEICQSDSVQLDQFLHLLICKTYFHPYLIRCGTYYLQTSGVEVTYS